MIRLDVLKGNLPAEKLYEKHSFRKCGTIQMFYEDTGWTEYELYESVLAKIQKLQKDNYLTLNKFEENPEDTELMKILE